SPPVDATSATISTARPLLASPTTELTSIEDRRIRAAEPGRASRRNALAEHPRHRPVSHRQQPKTTTRHASGTKLGPLTSKAAMAGPGLASRRGDDEDVGFSSGAMSTVASKSS